MLAKHEKEAGHGAAHLRYFLALAEERNITRAAALPHVTQPTLSRQLHDLEHEPGCELLERSRRIELTEEGRYLQRRACEIVELAASDTWGALVRDDDPLARFERATPEDLRARPPIVSRRAMRHGTLPRWLDADEADLDVRATYNLALNASLLAREGMGCMLCLEGLVDASERTGLAFLPFDPPLASPIHLAWKKNQTLSRSAKLFLQRVREDAGKADG